MEYELRDQGLPGNAPALCILHSASPNSSCAGKLSEKEIQMRRTLTRTWAPSLRRRVRMLPHWALASSVSCNPRRRKAHSRM